MRTILFLILIPLLHVVHAQTGVPQLGGASDAGQRTYDERVRTDRDRPQQDAPLTASAADPSFPGGDVAFEEFLRNNMRVPDQEPVPGSEDVVEIRFLVGEDGTIHNPRVVKSMGNDRDEEALRLVRLMPPWVPATMAGQPMPAHASISIPFGRLP
jgi:TonB family protein